MTKADVRRLLDELLADACQSQRGNELTALARVVAARLVWERPAESDSEARDRGER